MEASTYVVPRSPTVGLLVGWVGHDRSSVAYSSGALSTASRLSSVTNSFLLQVVPALFLPLSFRESASTEAQLPRTLAFSASARFFGISHHFLMTLTLFDGHPYLARNT